MDVCHDDVCMRVCDALDERATGAFDSVFRPEATKTQRTLECGHIVRVQMVRHDGVRWLCACHTSHIVIRNVRRCVLSTRIRIAFGENGSIN